ncbi:MAG: hypothetical protein M3220_13165, partial [Chloroflexota bacterium]|nr:hypothetical protein [Chloroflexota bacterium]
MSHLKVFLFGPPRFEREGETIEVSLRKATALLAYLLVIGSASSRDALATLFWPESDQSSSRTNLRRALYRINKEVGDEVLIATWDTIGRNPDADIWIDVEAYRAHLATGFADGPVPVASRSQLLDAVALYDDDFLAGFTLPDSPGFDEWQWFQREELRRSLAQVLLELAKVHETQAEWEPAVAYARRWLAMDPLHEPAHRQLMRLYALSGRQTAALRQYEQCVQ